MTKEFELLCQLCWSQYQLDQCCPDVGMGLSFKMIVQDIVKSLSFDVPSNVQDQVVLWMQNKSA